MQRIHVGSQNPTKINAVKNVLLTSKLFEGADVSGVDVDIEEFGHPKNINETTKGAKDRARAAFDGADYGIGIESGLLEITESDEGYLEVPICAIYDGERYVIGAGPANAWPYEMQKMILDGLDGSQAFKQLGLTSHEKVGAVKGAIHALTHGRIDRTMVNELAVTMALVQLENPELYRHSDL